MGWSGFYLIRIRVVMGSLVRQSKGLTYGGGSVLVKIPS